MSPLRVGIIGAGAWAVGAHIPAFQACDGVALVGICDTDWDRARAVAADAGIPTAHPSVDSMLRAAALDMVSIATPTASHRRAAETCLAAGLHVLCEKPLAYTVEDARALATQA